MSALGLVTIGWALLACGFSALAWWRVVRRPTLVSAPANASVLLVRPVDAPTASELANLAAPVDYRGPLEQVVLAPTRPIAEGPRWIASDPRTANRKVGHLLRALEDTALGDRVLVAIDADVRVTGELLTALVGPIVAGGALCSAAPEPLSAKGIAARATRGLLVGTHHSFVALDALRAGPPAVCGKALAFGAAGLAELPSLGAHAGEDLELGLRLTRAGQTVRLATQPALVPQTERASFRAVVDRFTRWMLVLRAHRPLLYPTVPLLFCPTVPLTLLAGMVRTPEAILAVAGLWLTRVGFSRALGVRSTEGWRVGAAFDWLLGEALLLAAFVASVPLQRITWRGRRFRLRAGGALLPLAEGE